MQVAEVFTGSPGAFAQDGRELRTKVLVDERLGLSADGGAP